MTKRVPQFEFFDSKILGEWFVSADHNCVKGEMGYLTLSVPVNTFLYNDISRSFEIVLDYPYVLSDSIIRNMAVNFYDAYLND